MAPQKNNPARWGIRGYTERGGREKQNNLEVGWEGRAENSKGCHGAQGRLVNQPGGKADKAKTKKNNKEKTWEAI